MTLHLQTPCVTAAGAVAVSPAAEQGSDAALHQLPKVIDWRLDIREQRYVVEILISTPERPEGSWHTAANEASSWAAISEAVHSFDRIRKAARAAA